MTPRERKALAEQLTGNPLLNDILATIERNATEALIYAKTEQDRVDSQWRVRAARQFAEELVMAINTPTGNGAPA